MHDELSDELVRSSLFVVCCGGLDRAGAELPALTIYGCNCFFSAAPNNRGNSNSAARN